MESFDCEITKKDYRNSFILSYRSLYETEEYLQDVLDFAIEGRDLFL